MLSKFGKQMRKYRIDYTYTLGKLADKLSISTSYVSAIENGKRSVPAEILNKLVVLFKLSKEDEVEFRELATEHADSVKINLDKVSREQRGLAFAFARKIESLTDEEIQGIKFLLGDEEANE